MTWNGTNKVIRKTMEKEIQYYEGKRTKKPWITIEMINKMEERRIYINRRGEENKRVCGKLLETHGRKL